LRKVSAVTGDVRTAIPIAAKMTFRFVPIVELQFLLLVPLLRKSTLSPATPLPSNGACLSRKPRPMPTSSAPWSPKNLRDVAIQRGDCYAKAATLKKPPRSPETASCAEAFTCFLYLVFFVSFVCESSGVYRIALAAADRSQTFDPRAVAGSARWMSDLASASVRARYRPCLKP
jgi:hypothetical protein